MGEIDLAPTDESFPHHWRAERLARRPLILPRLHFTYPAEAEEVERGALEVLIYPGQAKGEAPEGKLVDESGQAEQTDLERPPGMLDSVQSVDAASSRANPPFLATCALGFRDPAVPTGIWTTPHPDWLCAVAGGYAYLINAADPRRFVMIEQRPVLTVLPVPGEDLLLFIGHTSIVAWGHSGERWRSAKLSDEGIAIERVEGGVLHGRGWTMRTDREGPFLLDLKTGALQ